MHTNKRGQELVVRFYSVEIQPTDCPDGPYEPFTISLSYPTTKAQDLDPVGETALNHVLRRAVKVEAREHGFAPGTTFVLHNARFTGTHILPANQAQ